MTVMYRGAGPGANTFDFTPAFYEEYCGKEVIPALLREKCTSLRGAAQRLENKVNCIREASNTRCRAIMDAAKQKVIDDTPLYEQCLRDGEKHFNRAHPPEFQRSNNCAYERTPTGGPNSRGTKWRRLLPAACRPSTYVGRDGLDCCNGLPLADAPLGSECKAFYPAR